ncbi:MAG: hypothetical protein B7Z52_05485, partial [Burkholderiales bacterium 12-64-5]
MSHHRSAPIRMRTGDAGQTSLPSAASAERAHWCIPCLQQVVPILSLAMSIRVAIRHTTQYRFDRRVTLGPHVVRLRPAPHSRT